MLRNFVIDKERNLMLSNDLLGTKCYVTQLVDTIQNIPNKQSCTIGLYGGWGSGKSTIIETAKQQLESDLRKKYKVVVYDAWKYSGDSFRRTFLLHMQSALKLNPGNDMDSFYKGNYGGNMPQSNYPYKRFMHNSYSIADYMVVFMDYSSLH